MNVLRIDKQVTVGGTYGLSTYPRTTRWVASHSWSNLRTIRCLRIACVDVATDSVLQAIYMYLIVRPEVESCRVFRWIWIMSVKS